MSTHWSDEFAYPFHDAVCGDEDLLYSALGHGHLGRLAAYCPAQDRYYRVSVSELPPDMPGPTAAFVRGFLTGSLPDRPDETTAAEGAFDVYNNAARRYLATGEWPEELQGEWATPLSLEAWPDLAVRGLRLIAQYLPDTYDISTALDTHALPWRPASISAALEHERRVVASSQFHAPQSREKIADAVMAFVIDLFAEADLDLVTECPVHQNVRIQLLTDPMVRLRCPLDDAAHILQVRSLD